MPSRLLWKPCSTLAPGVGGSFQAPRDSGFARSCGYRGVNTQLMGPWSRADKHRRRPPSGVQQVSVGAGDHLASRQARASWFDGTFVGGDRRGAARLALILRRWIRRPGFSGAPHRGPSRGPSVHLIRGRSCSGRRIWLHLAEPVTPPLAEISSPGPACCLERKRSARRP
jgi:hypothetical protein